ncbi:MAG: methyltransferase [Myxococcales bacterium]|nr:methyltransferase [Myxococcales bacterium]
MIWRSLRVSDHGTHHIDAEGAPAYSERFDEVLKFHAPGLAPVRLDGHAWHVRPDGKAAYDRRFAQTFGYYEDLASVSTRDGWFHITAAGEDVYPERHAWCGNFQEGRCAARDGTGIYYHLQRDGRAAYSARWRYAGDYRDGIAVVQARDGHSTHIDPVGELVHGNWFLDLDVFHKGLARARDDGGWMHVDGRGRPIYVRRFLTVEPFYNGQARVERFDGALEVIDESGAMLVELRPPRRSEFATLSSDMVGFWRTQAIAVAVQLGVIEELPATEVEVSERCALTHDGTKRLLRALGELGLTSQESGRWNLTQRGEHLRADHPLTLADAALEYAGPFSDMWSRLPASLRRDSTWTAPDVFSEVARDAARLLGHHRMLRSYARHDYGGVCDVLALRSGERIIDAGGGVGVLAQLVLDANPSAQVTVLERPEVVMMAQSSNPRLRWHSGSLLEPWGIEADAVMLSRVLHDWDDDDARRILSHARAALPLGGRVYIIEMLIPEGTATGALCDLHLLMATGGRERSVEEFAGLLAASGYQLESVQRLAALPSVIVGVAS